MSEDLFKRAQELVRKVKNTMRVVYQLAFIVTSEAPEAKEAEALLNKMVEEGMITEAQKWKAIEDTIRWRKRVLDRVFLDAYDHEKLAEKMREEYEQNKAGV